MADATVAFCEGKTEITTALLSTALVTLMKNDKHSRGLQALCDGGSDLNLILSRVVRTERWHTVRCTVKIGGLDT